LSSKDADLSDFQQTSRVFEQYKPDYVIHLAANVGGLYKNMTQKVDMFEKNILMNMNVLKCCHQYKVKKVVCCLSTCIFPDNTTYPKDETMLHQGPPHTSNDAYAYAKRMLEVQCKAYQEQYGSRFACVIPTNIYGAYDNYSLEDGHVIPSLIHKCYLAKKKGEDFVIRGSGKPLRQFIYSHDLARLMMWVLEHYEDKEPIILSVSEKDEVSIADIGKQIAKEFDYEQHIVFDTTFSDGQFKKTANNGKLLGLIQDFSFTPLEKGIKESVQWFQENVNVCRK
jgi:GDP-L-fucose synthase